MSHSDDPSTSIMMSPPSARLALLVLPRLNTFAIAFLLISGSFSVTCFGAIRSSFSALAAATRALANSLINGASGNCS